MVQHAQDKVPLEDPFDGNLFAVDETPQQGGQIKRVHWPPEGPSPPPMVSTSDSVASVASNSVHSPSWNSTTPPPPSSYIDSLLSVKTVLILLSLLVGLISLRSAQSATGDVHQSVPLPLRPLVGVFGSTPKVEQSVPPLVAQYIRDVVRDVTGSQWSPRDFALAADGATIVTSLTTGGPLSAKHLSPHPAETILRDNSNGGRCWSMPGPRGQVGIMLPQFIHPSSITIDHAPAHIAVDITQAPRRITVWGLLDEEYEAYLAHRSLPNVSEAPPITDAYVFMRLADIEYDIHASQPSQTFQIDPEKRDAKVEFGVYVVEVVDNWGGPCTCIYRVRIHGEVSE